MPIGTSHGTRYLTNGYRTQIDQTYKNTSDMVAENGTQLAQRSRKFPNIGLTSSAVSPNSWS